MPPPLSSPCVQGEEGRWALFRIGFGEGFSHGGVGLDVFEFHIVHDAEVAASQGVGHGFGDFGFGEDDDGAVFGLFGDVFLVEGDGHGAAFFGFGLEAAFVGLGLVGLEFGADVFTDVDVGDIDRQDFEGGVGVEALGEHGFGDVVGVFEHVFVVVGAADGGDDAFADAGDDGFLGGAADEALDVGANGDAGL